jgi:hypothetical protein
MLSLEPSSGKTWGLEKRNNTQAMEYEAFVIMGGVQLVCIFGYD